MSRFKIGDIVIKKTGGDKMSIIEIDDSNYKCIWCDDKLVREQVFSEEDITSLNDYKNFLKIEEREDKINEIFKKSN